MKTSDNGRKFIELWEGVILRAYRDSGGTWTIGYGHTSGAGLPRVYPGLTITAEEADQILASDLASVEIDVNHHVVGSCNQNQFDALVSFDYNTGGLNRSSLLRATNEGTATEQDFLMWDHVGRSFNEGLYRRRVAEWTLFTTGEVIGP